MTELNSSLCQLEWLLATGGSTNIQEVHPAKKSSSSSNSPNVPLKDDEKPPYSYSQLIRLAIESHVDKKCTLSGIYQFIADNFVYYKENKNASWKNSIRHNLSLNKQFRKLEKVEGEKGSHWVCTDENEKKSKILQGSAARINPAVERLVKNYSTPRQRSLESAPYSPTEDMAGHPLARPIQRVFMEDPATISLASGDYSNITNRTLTSLQLNGMNKDDITMNTDDDLSDLNLFASHDLSASFRRVYDQIFHEKPMDQKQQEAQIDWLKIGLETAGLDYRNEEELFNMDTDRFTDYLTNGFPDYAQLPSEQSTPRTCQSRGVSREMSDLSSNHEAPITHGHEESDDEFDWTTIT